MIISENNNTVEITAKLVTRLIAEQFPQWAHLQIKPVELSGIDNRTFRLGSEMSIRLPSASVYVEQVQKEQKWLPILAPHLSLPIPKPIAMGQPSAHYPWHWSIYNWIEGESANTRSIDEVHMQQIAQKLAQFLNELHKIDTMGGPPPGPHNWWRGANPSVYDAGTRSSIEKLRGFIDHERATAVWEKAISSKWDHSPVWIHGDFASGNFLVKDGEVVAIIDFGCMGIGDPACDLVIAWTFLKNESRALFKEHLLLDPATWERARGWALWKALFELAQLEIKTSTKAIEQLCIINEVLDEHEI